MKVNFNGMPSVMSNRTLKPGEGMEYSGSERSKPSLRGSKDPERFMNKELKESIKQNNTKLTGASNIKSLIRSAATRD